MNEELHDLEKHVVNLIEEGLRAQKIDAQRAKSIAAAILLHLKAEMTEFQLYQVSEALQQSFPELMPITAEADDVYEQRIHDAVVAHASNLIKQGNLAEAGALLTNAIEKNQEICIDG